MAQIKRAGIIKLPVSAFSELSLDVVPYCLDQPYLLGLPW